MSTLSYPGMTGYFPSKWFITFIKSGRCSRVDCGRKSFMCGVHWHPETSSQLTMFSPRKRIDSTIHPSGFSRDTILTPPVITWSQWLFPWIIQSSTPGGCGSTLHPGSLYLSGAWGHNYPNRQPESPGGVLTHVCPNVLCPQVEPHGAWRTPLKRWRRQVQAVTDIMYWSCEKYAIFPHFLWFHLRSPWKCSIFAPIESTSVCVVFGLSTEYSNEGTAPCTVVAVASNWWR